MSVPMPAKGWYVEDRLSIHVWYGSLDQGVGRPSSYLDLSFPLCELTPVITFLVCVSLSVYFTHLTNIYLAPSLCQTLPYTRNIEKNYCLWLRRDSL